ncbi:serine/threonine protein kinase [Rhizina undulata]
MVLEHRNTPLLCPIPTHMASQFHYPPPNETGLKDEYDEDVWGYLVSKDRDHGKTLKLTKKGDSSDSNDKELQQEGCNQKDSCEKWIHYRKPRSFEIYKSEPIAILEDFSTNGTMVGDVAASRHNYCNLYTSNEFKIAGGIEFIVRYPHHMLTSDFYNTYERGQELVSGTFALVSNAVERTYVHVYQVDHPSVLSLQGAYQEEDGIYLVLEMTREGTC